MPPRRHVGSTSSARKRTRDIASSSQNPHNFDGFHFLSAKNEQWYNARIRKTVLVEINVNLTLENQHYFRESFDHVG